MTVHYHGGKTVYLQGALDLLILQTLAVAPNHGLCPALHRFEAAGIIASEMTRPITIAVLAYIG